MSSDSYRQCYEGLQAQLEGLLHTITQPDESNVSLSAALKELQAYFQREVMALEVDALAADKTSQVLSHRTEMHKQLRLLKMDAMFLQAARQSATTQQRLKQVRERLQLLLEGCQAILSGPEM